MECFLAEAAAEAAMTLLMIFAVHKSWPPCTVAWHMKMRMTQGGGVRRGEREEGKRRASESSCGGRRAALWQVADLWTGVPGLMTLPEPLCDITPPFGASEDHIFI